MNWELVYYIFLIIVTYFLGVTNYASKNTRYVVFILLCLYSVTIRYSGFDVDMKVYAETLSHTSPETIVLRLLTPYYLKEWFYWIISSVIFIIIGREEIVFILYDIFAIILILKVTKRINIPLYFIILFILFFPSLMGMQNVYRQFLSAVFLLYSITLSNKNRKWSIFYFLIAGFTHNVAFLFLPIYFIKKKILFVFSSLTILFLVLPKATGTKSYSSTGLDLTYIYLSVLAIILVFIILSNKFKLDKKNIMIFSTAIYYFLLMLESKILLGSAQSERVGMIVLQLLLPYICWIMEEKYNNRILVRLIIITVLIIPTFIFSSALNMLKT